MTTQYIITDPCYILPNKTWDLICNSCENDDYYNGKFDRLVTEELNKLAGTTNAQACATGFGDWSNTMHCSNDEKVIEADFFADSGMVCVVEFTKKIQQALDVNGNNGLLERGGIALINTENEVKIEMDTSNKNWTVVYIDDGEDCFNSIPSDDEEYDDDE